MFNNILNMEGVEKLTKNEQKELNGGLGPIGCSGNCTGKPSGSRCYYDDHCGCPGECGGGQCWPY